MIITPKFRGQLKAFTKKARNNPKWFIDNFCWVKHPAAGVIPFRLFSYQLKCLNSFRNNRFSIFRKTRQSGISTLCGAFALWFAMFFPHKTILIVSKREKDAVDFLNKNIKFVYFRLPDWMQEIWKCEFNQHEARFNNGSTITSLTSSEDTLRSNSASLNIIDESGYMPHMDGMWAAGEPTLQHGGYVIVISTTNGQGNWYWRTWVDAIAGYNDFHPIEVYWYDMDWKIEYLDHISGKNKIIAPRNGIRKCVTPEEIKKYGKYVSPWLKNEYRRLTERGDDRKFRQEVLAEFLGTGNTVLSRNTLAKLELSEDKEYQTVGTVDYVNPITGERMILDFGDDLWVWEKPKENHMYSLGVDISSGESIDYSVIQVLDITSRCQVAEYRGKPLPKKLAYMADFLGRYYNYGVIVPERTGIGVPVCQELEREILYPTLYKHQLRSNTSKVTGFPTTGQSKGILVAALLNNLETEDEENLFLTRSHRFTQEAQIFVHLTASKVGAEPGIGNNDDCMIAMSLALVGAGSALKYNTSNLLPLRTQDSSLLLLPGSLMPGAAIPGAPAVIRKQMEGPGDLIDKSDMYKSGAMMPFTIGTAAPQRQTQLEILAEFTNQIASNPGGKVDAVKERKHTLDKK